MLESLKSLKRVVVDYISQATYPQRKKQAYPVIDLFYWQPKKGGNFGDELARVIVELMLARQGFTLSDEVSCQKQLMTIGSILHYAKTGTVIWGTGRNGRPKDHEYRFNDLDVRAVRGPRTREFLKQKNIEVPEVYGDPGLLIAKLTGDRFSPTGEKEVALVPNLNDYWANYDFSNIDIPVIDPRQSWNKVVAEIVKYKFIIASSLHGLVVAEAFGIPARYVRLTEVEGLFKYHDYYEGTGRKLTHIPTSVEDAQKLKGEPPPVIDLEKLAASFPYDLWK